MSGARIIGANDRPSFWGAQRFSGPGYYLLADPMSNSTKYGFWCEDDGQYIVLRETRDSPILLWMSHRAFDRQEVWRFHPTE